MSSFVFDPEALADQVPCSYPPSVVCLEPDAIRWPRASLLPPPESTATLLEALLEAWGRTEQALGYRHERIVNLGYVPTAVDDDALHRLAQMIALRPAPPLAASTWLAITVRAIGRQTQCDVPAGLGVRSVPVGGAKAELYETDHPLTARVEWNAIPVQLLPPSTPALTTDAHSALLSVGGVRVGQRIAVGALIQGRPVLSSVVVTEVTRADVKVRRHEEKSPRAAARPRIVAWQGPLVSSQFSQPLSGVRAFELAKPVGLYGATAEMWPRVPDPVRYELSDPIGGLRYFTAPSQAKPASEHALRAFAATAGEPRVVSVHGSVWLVGASRGIFLSRDGGTSWAVTGMKNWVATSVCWVEDGLFLGTESHGVQRSTDEGQSWEPLKGGTLVTRGPDGLTISLGRLPRCPIRALQLYSTGPDSALLLAGTAAGPYYQLLGDPAWYPRASGLPLVGKRNGAGGPAITALALEAATGALWLGTERGLFRSTGLDEPWQAVKFFAEPHAVTALATDLEGSVVVAFEGGGLFRVDADGLLPLRVSTSEEGEVAPYTVRCIRVQEQGWWVGTDGGCFWSADGEQWVQLSCQAVTSLAVCPNGGALVASRLHGPVDSEWPDFGLNEGWLDLDRKQSSIRPGPALVVDEVTGASETVQVLGASEVRLTDFGLERRVTRLTLEPNAAMRGFSRRSTRVYPAVRELGALEPVASLDASEPALNASQLLDKQLLVDRATADLSGRTVVVSGAPLRVQLPADTELQELDSHSCVRLSHSTLATLTALPVQTSQGVAVRVRTPDGLEGTASVSTLLLQPGDPKAPRLAERRNVVGCERGTAFAQLALDEPLTLPFDPTATTVYGNVVSATHGRQVESEVLGSGDPTRRRQRFKLLLPLCWLPAPEGGASPSLEVRVDGKLWRRVASRAELGPEDQAYSVECDLRGSTWIEFGDGINGQRLPTGIENVTVRYRSGGRSVGNQPAGTIRLLRSHPRGVKAARNLLPAAGGADLESLANLRDRIPLHAREPGRVVSEADYLDYLTLLPDIAKVSVRRLFDGHRHVVHLTVATNEASNGWALDPNSRLFAPLRALSRHGPLELASVEVAWFAVTLEVAVAAELPPDPVLREVSSALQTAFDFEARNIGDAVLASHLVSEAMRVSGVTNAVVRRLAPQGGSSSSHAVARLPAMPARFDPETGKLMPGRLWLLPPQAPAPLQGASVSSGETTGLTLCLMENA